ncbi:MAG: TetR/AcrR family transcriptional regulator [Clostridiales bacterium]|nr:TetR/AcrR family transcriptional regulator [Clostridiales bacterium]MBR3342448.1 TetR/AcrR family transcriptional regulator [Clostridiales bacterium]
MANFTKKAIKDTFIELLEDHPLSDITVKDIVEKCGINRNSFYYHYHDLPELIEEIVKEDAEEIIRKYPSVKSIVECYDAAIEFASQHRRAIMHIYKSVNREMFEGYLMEVCECLVRSYTNMVVSTESVNEGNIEIIVNYYKCVCFGLLIEWLNKGMKETDSQNFRKILVMRKDLILELLRELQE